MGEKVNTYLSKLSREMKLNEKKLKEHYAKGHIQYLKKPTKYLRFRRESLHMEKGTVAFILNPTNEIEYARGFPKIRRLLLLEKGIGKCFRKPFYVEEKMDGYNVRLVKNKEAEHGFYALTKGGVICEYSTQNIKEENGKQIEKFFNDHPDMMVCGEVVGLRNPYQERSYPEAKNFGYFVFDIKQRKTGKSLAIMEKLKLLQKYKIKGVKNYGLFTSKDGAKIVNIVRKLGKSGREGVILKSPDMKDQIKYTANQSTNNDLRYAFRFPFDYGQPFMFRRLVRQAFQAYEKGLKGKALEQEACELGKSILIPMVNTIRNIKQGGEETEDFEIQVPSIEFGNAFIEHLKDFGVKVTVEKTRKTKDGIVMKVKRHYQATNDKIKAYLDGEFCQD